MNGAQCLSVFRSLRRRLPAAPVWLPPRWIQKWQDFGMSVRSNSATQKLKRG